MSKEKISTYEEVVAQYVVAMEKRDTDLLAKILSKRFPCPFCKKTVHALEAAKRAMLHGLACPHCGEVFVGRF